MRYKRIITIVIVAAIGGMVGLFILGASTPPKPARMTSLQAGPAPWQPEMSHLGERLAALNLPPTGKESFHHHALLKVVVDGKDVLVPKNIGYTGGGFTSLHTHDTGDH